MTWNYRVVKHTYEDGYEWYAIHEVYYSNGKPSMCSHDKVAPCGATLEELKVDFANYAKALEAPVLDEKEFQCDGKSE
jgi:hypothetical protein